MIVCLVLDMNHFSQMLKTEQEKATGLKELHDFKLNYPIYLSVYAWFSALSCVGLITCTGCKVE